MNIKVLQEKPVRVLNETHPAVRKKYYKQIKSLLKCQTLSYIMI